MLWDKIPVLQAGVQKQENKRLMQEAVSAVTIFWSKIQVTSVRKSMKLCILKPIPPFIDK